MMITAVMKRGGRSALGSVLASAGTLLLRKRFLARTPQEQQQEAVLAPGSELHALVFEKFIERTHSATLVELLRIKLGFPREVFERAVNPVIKGYAEFVQLPPTSETQQHGNPSDLFTRALDVASRALDYRRGQILPRGAAPEVIGAQAHRWTYAVFVAALLCGVGRNSLDVHVRLAVQLFDRLVPSSVLEWLAADPVLMRELLAFLSGDISARTGAISQLVLRAAAESGGRDHLQGGRADLSVQAAAPATDSREVKAVGGFDGRSTPCTIVAAQPDAATTAISESAPRDEETEYLEDFDEKRGARAEQFRTTDPALAQAPEAARRFIDWVRQELSDGALRVNEAGALVHCVQEGMLLVSPRIFREFAKRFGEDGSRGSANAPGEPDIGKSIQRQVLRAGWHLRADKGVNILTYQVMRGDRAVSRLSGVVIRNPRRIVNPVPPINPLLVRLRQVHGDA
ncbi:MAG: hypothetical protein EPO27_14580 [Betaproteobacteria bacterium]|nr:MAG: hypothetical protein EPO27_14580 [Betaproteobacteria bacterium]